MLWEGRMGENGRDAKWVRVRMTAEGKVVRRCVKPGKGGESLLGAYGRRFEFGTGRSDAYGEQNG
jgi:hypothetical protein